MNLNLKSCTKALALAALGALIAGSAVTPASAQSCGKARISNVTVGKDTLNGSNYFWDVTPGSTVTVTLSCVESTASSIQVIVQNSKGTNYCTSATKTGTGIYTFTYPVPSGQCGITMVIAYNTTACSPSTGKLATDSHGGCTGHLRTASGVNACKVTFTNCPGTVDLKCKASDLSPADIITAAIAGVSAKDCTGNPLGVTPTAALPTGDDCHRSAVVTLNATNGCDSASCKVTVTWSLPGAPVIDGLPTGGEQGCNNAPSCANLTAHDKCTTGIPVTCKPGSITKDGCKRTQSFDYCATNCLTTTKQTVNYTWTADSGVTIDASDKTLDCNVIPSDDSVNADVHASSDCSGVNVTVTHDDATHEGCNYSQVFHIAAIETSGCGLSATKDVTYHWTVDAGPTITASNKDLPCNVIPSDDSVTADVSASSDCSDVNITVTHDPAQNTSNCHWSQVFHITATETSGCLLSASKDVTYTWTVVTVTVTPPGPANVCLEDYIATDVFPDAFGVSVATAVDSCGNSVDVTFSDSSQTDQTCDLGDGFTFIRTWTATSACGSDSKTQLISVCPCVPQCIPFSEGGCVVTLGYWKTHGPGDCNNGQNPDNWPKAGVIIVGCDPFDLSDPGQAELVCGLLSASGQHLIPQLIAAQMNILHGVSPATLVPGTTKTIQDIINAANDCICHNGSNCKQYTDILNLFNSGLLPGGPKHCDDSCPQ